MPGTTFPPARSNSGFQTVCKWRLDVSAVAGGQAVKMHQCDQSQRGDLSPWPAFALKQQKRSA
jgi:hypothetical protein